MNTPSDGGAPENETGASEGQVFPELDIAGQTLHLDDESEASVRAAHLPAEATVRTIGLVLILIGVNFLLGIGLAFSSPRMGETIAKQAALAGVDSSIVRNILFFVGFVGFALYVALGLALRELKDWARWTVVVLTGLGLVSRVSSTVLLGPDQLRQALTPGHRGLETLIGLGISVYLIFRLLTPESAFVCSKHYRFAVSETLRIRPAMGLRDWALLIVFLLNSVLGLIVVLL
jgi:hypothetical protein